MRHASMALVALKSMSDMSEKTRRDSHRVAPHDDGDDFSFSVDDGDDDGAALKSERRV